MNKNRAFRRPQVAVTGHELAAIDAIRAAYLACNASDPDGKGSPLAWEITPGNEYGGQPTAMGHLAQAGRVAWQQVGIVDVDMWALMQDNGESAAYNLGLYISDDYDLRVMFPLA